MIKSSYAFVLHRLYWLDLTNIKSSMPDGSGIKDHVNTNGATDAFVYKVHFL